MYIPNLLFLKNAHNTYKRYRYLLAYLALPWEDRFYELGRAPEFGTQAWTGEPPTPEAKARRVREYVGWVSVCV